MEEGGVFKIVAIDWSGQNSSYENVAEVHTLRQLKMLLIYYIISLIAPFGNRFGRKFFPETSSFVLKRSGYVELFRKKLTNLPGC